MTQPIHVPRHSSTPASNQTSGPNNREKSSINAAASETRETAAVRSPLSEDEKFELLSAYLDDEVSPEERRSVERWLASDTKIQQHYEAQLKLRQAMRSLFRR